MSLVNQSEVLKKFFIIDLMNEYLNNDVKKIIRDRRTFSMSIEYLFDYVCKFVTYCKNHFRRMRLLLDVKINT